MDQHQATSTATTGEMNTDTPLEEPKSVIELFGRQVSRSRTASPANFEESLSKYPKFVVPMTDNDTVRLHARAELKSRIEPKADPNLVIEWLKDDVPVRTNRRVTTYFNYGYAALIITGFEEKDGGRYTCIATNQYGTDRAEASLQLDTRYRSRQGEDKSREEAIKRLLRLKEAMKQADKADEKRKADNAAKLKHEAELEAEKRRLADIARRDARIEEARRRAAEAQAKEEAEARAKAAAAADARRILAECGALRKQRLQNQNQFQNQYQQQHQQQQQQQWPGSSWMSASEASSRSSSALALSGPKYIWIPYRELEDSIIYKRELTMYETIREFENVSTDATQTQSSSTDAFFDDQRALMESNQQVKVLHSTNEGDSKSQLAQVESSALAAPSNDQDSSQAASTSHLKQEQFINRRREQEQQLQLQLQLQQQQLQLQQQQQQHLQAQKHSHQVSKFADQSNHMENIRTNNDRFDYFIRVPYRETEDSIFYRREKEIYETVIEYEDDQDKEQKESKVQAESISESGNVLSSGDKSASVSKEAKIILQRRLRGGDREASASSSAISVEASRSQQASGERSKIREVKKEGSRLEAAKSGEFAKFTGQADSNVGQSRVGQSISSGVQLEIRQKVADELVAFARNDQVSSGAGSVALHGAGYYIRIPYRELEDSLFLKRERTIYETVVEYETPTNQAVTEVENKMLEPREADAAGKSPSNTETGVDTKSSDIIQDSRQSGDEEDHHPAGLRQRVSLTIELSKPEADQFVRPSAVDDDINMDKQSKTATESETMEPEVILDVSTNYMIEVLESEKVTPSLVEPSSLLVEEEMPTTSIAEHADRLLMDATRSAAEEIEIRGQSEAEISRGDQQKEPNAKTSTTASEEKPKEEPRRLLTASDLEERALRRRLRGGETLTPISISRSSSPTPSYIPMSYQRLSISPIPRTTTPRSSYGEGKYSSERSSYLTNLQRSRSISPYITGRRSASPRPSSTSSSYRRWSA